MCYKCGEAGHQARRCKKKAAAKGEGEQADGVDGVKDETMKEEVKDGQSKAGRGRVKAVKATQPPTANGHVADAHKKRERSDLAPQAAPVQKAGKQNKAIEADAPATGNKRKREDKPQQQQLSKRERRELAEESKFEAMVSDYKKKYFSEADEPMVSKVGGGATAEGERKRPTSRWFEVDE